MVAGAKAAGERALDAVVRELFQASWGKARAWIESGKITVRGVTVTDPRAPVREGDEVALHMNAPRARREGEPALPRDAVVHVDAHVVVVAKPPGISTVPYEEGERGTLDELVRKHLSKLGSGGGRPALGVVHRIDKETSGLVVFTRTWLAKKSLASQFRAHTVHRRYLAIAHGDVSAATIRSHLVVDRGDGLRGSLEAKGRKPRAEGEAQLAITHVERVEPLRGATLIACRLETGRTHQIRIHLSEAGHPLLGDRVYVRGYKGEVLPAPRLMLHAAELGFVHPATGKAMRWSLPMPEDMASVMRALQLSGRGTRSPSR
jgi:23S rRNA pseudouridine1911/1915/1917 synthase